VSSSTGDPSSDITSPSATSSVPLSPAPHNEPASCRHVGWSRYVAFALIVSCTAGWDLWSKQTVFSMVGYPEKTEWEWVGFADNVRFCYWTNLNEGALWGFGQGFSRVFAGFSILAGAAILYWLFVKQAAQSWWLLVSLAMISGGTIGNLYDRLGLHGMVDPNDGLPRYAVRDFLHFHLFGFYDWPTFNFADVFLVTGAIMLALYSILMSNPPSQGNAAPSE
jgi:signal peptidase II